MKLLLLCTTIFFLLELSAAVGNRQGNSLVQRKNETLRVGKGENGLGLKLSIIYYHLKNSFSTVTDNNFPWDQEKVSSGLSRLKNGLFHNVCACSSFFIGNRQFRDFLFARHLHGFYIFFLAKLII